MPPRRQKKKRTGDAPVAQSSSRTTSSCTSRRKSGKLAGIDNLPLDILYEIAANLQPVDLLHLSRVSKAFRSLFLTPTAKSIWKRVLSSVVPKIPPLFPGMSEPAFTSLVFEHACQFCRKLTQRRVNWSLRTRMCPSCEKSNTKLSQDTAGSMINYVKDPESFPLPSRIFSSTFPHVVCVMIAASSDGRKHQYLNSDRMSVVAHYNTLTDDVARREFFKESCQRKNRILETASAMRQWEVDCERIRLTTKNEILGNREQEIIARLRSEGWGDELEHYMSRSGFHLPPFHEHPLVKKVQPLTERIWKNIRGPLIEWLEDKRNGRLREAAKNERCSMAIEFLGQYKRTHLDHLSRIPSALDFCRLPEVVELIDRPAEDSVSLSDFEALSPQMPNLCNNWFALAEEAMFQILEDEVCTHFDRPSAPLIDATELRGMIKLATTVWICDSDEVCPQSVHGTCSVLFYPECLYHSCFFRNSYKPWNCTALPDSWRPSVPLMSGTETKWRQPFSDSCLELCLGASLIVEEMVDLVGMDPDTTLASDLDGLSSKFGCAASGCRTQNAETGTTEIWVCDWREMVHHYARPGHLAGFDESELIIVKVMPEEYLSATIVEEDIRPVREYFCVRCLDTPTETVELSMPEMRDHYTSTHDYTATQALEEGVDYVRSPGAPSQTGLTSIERSKQQLLRFPTERVEIWISQKKKEEEDEQGDILPLLRKAMGNPSDDGWDD